MTARERHLAAMKKTAWEIRTTTSERRKKDLSKHLKRLRRELRIYDQLVGDSN